MDTTEPMAPSGPFTPTPSFRLHGPRRHEPPVGRIQCFDFGVEAEALRREPTWLEKGHNARTLVKHPDLRLVLIALCTGAGLHESRTDNRISVQTLSGYVRLHLDLEDTMVDLPAGRVLVLDKGIAHDLIALEESIILLSVSWDAPH